MNIELRGIGPVSLAELEARMAAYLNAGAPEPVVEGTEEERRRVFELLSSRGDAQMKSYLSSRI